MSLCADAVATGAVALARRCDELSTQLRQLAHTEDTHKRALEYVERVCVIGIGKLVASMDTGRRRRFFSGAIRSLTLDGKGRGVWRKRWVQSYELTDPLDTFISRRASACVFQDQGIGELAMILIASAT